MSEQTFEKVRGIIVDRLNVSEEDVVMGASLQEDLGADSLALVELIMALEDSFPEIDNIPDEDAEKIKSVKDVVDYIDMRISGASA